MLFYYPSFFRICQVYGPWPRIVFTKWYLGGLLLFKLKELIRNLPWEMQQCFCCKDVSETMIHWVIHYLFYQNLGEMPLDFSRVVEFPVNQEFISVSWILWMSCLDRFSFSYSLPRSLKPTLWSSFKRLICLTCILCVHHLPHVFSLCSLFSLFIRISGGI